MIRLGRGGAADALAWRMVCWKYRRWLTALGHRIGKDFRVGKFSHMTTVPGWGARAGFGLAVTMVTVLAVLAVESAAGAATEARPQHATHIRSIRSTAKAPAVKTPGKKTGNAPGAPAKTAAARPKPNPKPAPPWTIQLPSIKVTAGLLSLAAPAGPATGDTVSLPVPPLDKATTSAAWYRFTAVPGAAGNAVIVGHVDTYTGPGVFYDLYLLRPGDPVYVTADGTRRRFDVTSVHELAKSSFPVDQVFGGTRKHQLWLITCGGGFDYQSRHYLDNIVVSATWVPPTPPVSQLKKSKAGIRKKGPDKLSASQQKRARRTR